jgi:hypothetical protein
MVSYVERPILADQIRRAARQSQCSEIDRMFLNSVLSDLADKRRSDKFSDEKSVALTAMLTRSIEEEFSR